ncbi:sodium-coupled monocarboxylate transporter 1 isoform X3 [Drosophila sechellia]|uniref:sodium-coupled monocarboxylate transporter 1 isoform X3 n=1 Tax=Drosophila sechellia TaxID=7238 RepID=UPI0013DE2D28|nr:sodium-coupled monocarboxylate transporter 1 isoform X3 [Drosophila sechellia]
MDTYIFGTVDYTVFLCVTILSIAIGLYFGWIKKTKKAVETSPTATDTREISMPNFGSKKMNEYLMGSGNLKVFPVAMSLIASFISGVAILGTPSEIYYYGTQYSLIVVAIVIQGVAVSYIYLPVFSALQVRSAYEYLGMRFHPLIRNIVSIMFVIEVLLYTPFVVFVPALAFNQASGLNIHMIEILMIVVCVIYTLLWCIRTSGRWPSCLPLLWLWPSWPPATSPTWMTSSKACRPADASYLATSVLRRMCAIRFGVW